MRQLVPLAAVSLSVTGVERPPRGPCEEHTRPCPFPSSTNTQGTRRDPGPGLDVSHAVRGRAAGTDPTHQPTALSCSSPRRSGRKPPEIFTAASPAHTLHAARWRGAEVGVLLAPGARFPHLQVLPGPYFLPGGRGGSEGLPRKLC